MSHYQLCLKSNGVGALADLCDILTQTQADPWPVLYLPYAELVGDDNLGRHIKAGPPTAHWHWDWLAQPDVDALLDYSDKDVYVRTEKRDGTIRDFQVFDAYMQEPTLGEPILPQNGVPALGQCRGPIDVDFILNAEV